MKDETPGALGNEKTARQRLKRRIPSVESCVRTDLIPLHPNKHKAERLERLFRMASHAAGFFLLLSQKRFLADGSTSTTADWREYLGFPPPPEGPPEPSLAGNSTLLQPICNQASASFEGWLGNVKNTTSKRLRRLFRTLFFRLQKRESSLPPSEFQSLVEGLSVLRHECLAVNAMKAWTVPLSDPKGRAKICRMAGGKPVPVSAQAFDISRRHFLACAKRHSLPDLSNIQIEQTRGSASFRETSDASEKQLHDLSLQLDVEPANISSLFPHWLRISAGLGDPLAIPASFHRAFHIRNHGIQSPGSGGTGPETFPVHKSRRSHAVHNKRRSKRLKNEKCRPARPLNPSPFKPEAIESVGIVRSFPRGPGKPVFHAAIRSQMRDCFKKSREDFAPLVDTLSIDFGIDNLLTLTHPLSSGLFVGAGFLKKHAIPILSKIERLQAKIQSDDELFRNKWKLANPGKLEPEKASLLSKRITALRKKLSGLLESFLGNAFNRIASEIRPGCLVVERLDFRSPDLSPSMNRLLSNCGRRVLDKKLKDLHEKFGIEIVRVAPHWTSQECPACGFVHPNNRKWADFLCLSCGHKDHADLNASVNIGNRKDLPGSERLEKTTRGWKWRASGTFPRVPPSDWKAMGSMPAKLLLHFLWLNWKTKASGTIQLQKTEGAPSVRGMKFAGIFPASPPGTSVSLGVGPALPTPF